MKRVIGIIAAVLMAASLFGCTKAPKKTTPKTSPTPTPTPTASATPAPRSVAVPRARTVIPNVGPYYYGGVGAQPYGVPVPVPAVR